jgi:hypothetical protein
VAFIFSESLKCHCALIPDPVWGFIVQIKFLIWYNSHGLTWFFTVVQPTTNNETKNINNAGLKWAPQALRPLLSCL